MRKSKLIFTACTACCGIIFLVISIVFEKRVEPPNTIEEAKFYDFAEDPKDSPFLQALLNETNKAKTDIYVVAKNFTFPSDFPDIQESFENANRKNVKIHILSSNSNVPNFSTHNYFNNSVFKNGINSDFIIFDSKTILIPALPLFTIHNQLGVIYTNAPSLTDDVMRFYKLGTKVSRTDSDIGKSIWPSSLLVTHNMVHPHLIKDMGNISFAQTPGVIPPVRDESVKVLGSVLESARKSVMISTSRFIQKLGKKSEFTITDGILTAANYGADVKLLIGGSNYSLKQSLQWASTVASSKNVEVRVRGNVSVIPNYLIADSTFVVGSASFSDTAYSSSFGLRMVVSCFDDVRSKLESSFEREWNNSEPFSKYINLIWNSTISTK